MKRILIFVVASLAVGVAVGGVVSQTSPTARTVFSWTALPRPQKTLSTSAEPTVAKDTSSLSETKGETEKAPEGSIDMQLEQIAAQGIEVAPAGKGTLARVLTVPGTITLDPGRVARVPGRVEGTVTQMRKRLGDPVTPGEVVAVLDSREVADAKSEYLTAQVASDLQKTVFEAPTDSVGPEEHRRATISSGARNISGGRT
jgi:cobalt-zinc-cadmium efflux system membrane fusion protein